MDDHGCNQGDRGDFDCCCWPLVMDDEMTDLIILCTVLLIAGAITIGVIVLIVMAIVAMQER